MSDKNKKVRLNKLAKEFNVSIDRLLDFLKKEGMDNINPSSKVSHEVYMNLLGEFQPDLKAKIAADLASKEREERRSLQIQKEEEIKQKEIIKKDLNADIKTDETGSSIKKEKIGHKQEEKQEVQKSVESKDIIKAEAKKLSGIKITGETIDLDRLKSSNSKNNDDKKDKPVAKKKRKRITNKINTNEFKSKQKRKKNTIEISPEEAQKRVRETLAKLQGGGKKSSVKNRREKRLAHREIADKEMQEKTEDNKVIKIAEFATANEISTMMNVPVTDVISSLMSLGFMVTMNQRLDAETLQIIVEDFGFKVEFVGADVQESIEIEEEDSDEKLTERPPIVTIMGHVDHGKTSLLDYIREANVIAGEAGGITQHIGAYSVTLPNKRQISFLDTPGHEAFTAMRARGAKVTDIVVIVVAADDKVMPQTKEAITHAKAAEVPIIFAINKIDKESSDPEKIKSELAEMNMLVEDWGGKIQSQDISAKTGHGVPEILEKILLESEMLELKANSDRNAVGSIIEASLDKGKGYVTTVLVQKGTLKIGDYVLAGGYSGKVKALLNERGNKINSAGPSMPATLLGLNGAPTAGDTFNVIENEQEAKKIATKRMQLQREQGVRTQKHITLDEIGRRIALGDFQELNIIVKGDVDGSIEALSDSLEKLSTEAIKVNIIQKAVGQISESDIMLASASDAIIVGFQVRPSLKARKLAEAEQIDIRLYSVIYKAIEEIKLAMEGMLSPDTEEKIICNIEIREIFKISKVGTIAGCMVIDGKINRNSGVRIIRDGVVAYTGLLSSLKRFKDDVKEVQKGFECGLSIENFNDIKVGDIVEGYEEVEVKRTL